MSTQLKALGNEAMTVADKAQLAQLPDEEIWRSL